MPLRYLILALFYGLVNLPAQQQTSVGESMRVQISGAPGLEAALANHGVIGDHVHVHHAGGRQGASSVGPSPPATPPAATPSR